MNSGRGGRRYQRTDRVGELVREIVATAMDRIDDERLFSVAVTSVDVDNELSRATVYFDVLDAEDLPEAEEALEDHRHRLQRALSDQSRLRRTPALRFEVDPAIGAATRIETILEGLGFDSDTDASPDSAAPGADAPDADEPHDQAHGGSD